MKLYFSYRKIPELMGLTHHQQKAVYQCGLEAFLGEQPSRIWSGIPWLLGGIFSGSLAGWLLANRIGLSSHSELLIAAAGGLLGILITSLIGAQIFNAQLRPYLRRVLEERKEEIAQIQ